MREYGQIQCAFWRDPEVRALAGSAREFGAYLLTGPHSNGIGCYFLPAGYITADLGWGVETISKGFHELFSIGFVHRCEHTDFILIPKFLYWNEIANPNVARARVKEFDAVPKKSKVYRDLCVSMKRFGKHWPKDFGTVLDDGCKQEPTLPEKNQPREEPREEAPAAPVSATVEKGAGEQKASKGTRFRPVPLPDEWRAVALELRPDLNADTVYASFSDFWVAKPGANGIKLDWLATWRNWLRKESYPRGTQRPPRTPPEYGSTGKL